MTQQIEIELNGIIAAEYDDGILRIEINGRTWESYRTFDNRDAQQRDADWILKSGDPINKLIFLLDAVEQQGLAFGDEGRPVTD